MLYNIIIILLIYFCNIIRGEGGYFKHICVPQIYIILTLQCLCWVFCWTQTGCFYSQHPLGGSSVKHNMQTEDQNLSRHKIFYSKHLVLTDKHHPTAHLSAPFRPLTGSFLRSIAALHCPSQQRIQKLPNPYKIHKNTVASQHNIKNHIQFVQDTLTAGKHFNTLSKAIFF